MRNKLGYLRSRNGNSSLFVSWWPFCWGWIGFGYENFHGHKNAWVYLFGRYFTAP